MRVLPLGEPASSRRQHCWVNRTLRIRKNVVCYGRLRGGLLTEGHPRLGRHHPSPDLCGGLLAALLQPPRGSQRAKKHNATPCVSVSHGLSQHRYQNPDPSLQPPQFSQTSSPTTPLLFCYAPNPVLGPSHMLLFDPGKLLPQPFPQSDPPITQILAYLSPPQKGLHSASDIR